MKNKPIRIHCFSDTITVPEIKQVIAENKIKPSDLFGMDSLASDPVVIGYVNEEKKQASAGVFANKKRTDEAFDKARAEWDKREKELAAENAQLKRDVAKSSVSKLFSDAKEKRKLTEKQVKYIEARIPKFDVTEPDKIADEFDSFLDTQIDAFKTDASVFGIDVDGGDGGGGDTGGDDNKAAGGEPSKQGDSTGDDIFTKPL